MISSHRVLHEGYQGGDIHSNRTSEITPLVLEVVTMGICMILPGGIKRAEK